MHRNNFPHVSYYWFLLPDGIDKKTSNAVLVNERLVPGKNNKQVSLRSSIYFRLMPIRSMLGEWIKISYCKPLSNRSKNELMLSKPANFVFMRTLPQLIFDFIQLISNV
jgi:hypothetical protein